MQRQQLPVFVGMALAVAALLALGTVPEIAHSFAPPRGDDEAARLAYVARWLFVPGLCLLAGIGATANRRFFSDAIDGTRTPPSRSLEINLRYNQNTLEQAVLAAIAWAGLALSVAHDRLGLIGVLAVLFAIGRALFWSGYLIAPWARAFGFALTFYPTVVAFGYLALRALGVRA